MTRLISWRIRVEKWVFSDSDSRTSPSTEMFTQWGMANISRKRCMRTFFRLSDVLSTASKSFSQLHTSEPLSKSQPGVRDALVMQYFFIMQGIRAGSLLLVQWTWTYWVSSGMRIGWGRLWRPPHRRAAGVTGSGRSVRKTGRRAPSARSGCRLSDCFLETHTYIYRHRKGKRKKWAGWLLLSPPPKKLARTRSPKTTCWGREGKTELAGRLEF